MRNDEFDKMIDRADWPGVGQILIDHPGYTRHLVSRLHHPGKEKQRRTLEAFQIAAKVLDRERTLDLLRRLMWMLNEESGNFCPQASLAVGHIAQVDPEAVKPHLPSLQVYAEDPSELMRFPARKAVSLVQRALKRHGSTRGTP